MDEDIKIDNQIGVVNEWKPYDFLTYIEREIQVRGKDYQVMDLQADLGAIKTCITYANACGKGNYSVIEYILWLLDGIEDNTFTSLQFMPTLLRSYFGNTIESNSKKSNKIKVETKVKLSNGMITWLDSIKQ